MRVYSILMSVVVAFALATSFAFADAAIDSGNDVLILPEQLVVAQINDGWQDSTVLAVGAGDGITVAHNDWGGAVPADALAAQHQMAQQARLTASFAEPNKQLLYLSDGSVLTLYSSNMECRQTTMNSRHQEVAWQPC